MPQIKVIVEASYAIAQCDDAAFAHGVGRVVGALGSEAGFAGSMLNLVISMMHVLNCHKNPKPQLSGLK